MAVALLIGGSAPAMAAPPAPYVAAAPAPSPMAPTPEKPEDKAKETLPPIPEGVPTTAATAFLPTVNEMKAGREAEKEVPKEYTILKEGERYERLQRVSRAIVAATQSPAIAAAYLTEYHQPHPTDKSKRVPFEFRFTLVKPKDGHREVNAFSLAGGPVFVTTDLMDYARSDHELAAVLAHECGHICNHHVVQLVKKQAKAQKKMLWTALAGILLGVGAGAGNAIGAVYGAQLYSIAKLTGYGRDLEREADRVGVELLTHTQYSPVGMLTFMKKLARDEARQGEPDFGIYQSHPYSSERTALIEERLKQLKIAYDPATQRRVSRSFIVDVQPEQEDGKQFGEIRLNGVLVLRVADPGDQKTPLQRAQSIGQALDDLFLQRDVTIRDLRLGEDGAGIEAFGRPVIRILPGDARAAGRSAPDLAAAALKVIQTQLWSEKLDDIY